MRERGIEVSLIIAEFFKKFGAWIAAFFAGLLVLLTMWQAGKKVGKAENNAERIGEKAKEHEAIAVRQVNEQRAASERQNETLKGVNDVKNNIDSLSDDDVANKLRDKFSRD